MLFTTAVLQKDREATNISFFYVYCAANLDVYVQTQPVVIPEVTNYDHGMNSTATQSKTKL